MTLSPGRASGPREAQPEMLGEAQPEMRGEAQPGVAMLGEAQPENAR